MQFFRMRLILALIAGVTVVSLASTFFDVLAHKHLLRTELERRTAVLGADLQRQLEPVMAQNQTGLIQATVEQLHTYGEAMGVAVFTPQGRLLVASGPADVIASLPPAAVKKSAERGDKEARFGHDDSRQWLEEAFPLHSGSQLSGVLVILEDASFIRAESMDVWRRSFWRILAFVVLIVGVTFLCVRQFLTGPILRAAERLRLLRTGHALDPPDKARDEFGILTPLEREVETLTESLAEARAAAEAEARLRDAGESLWTAERLAVHVRERFGDSRIFVLSNREPYMHVHRGREVACEVPPSGLVTAIEPVLRACDGVWVAHGSGSDDRAMVDEFDRLRVPPDDPRYSLRRVWLSAEEEAGYYDGFANEGLWPLCHIAHTRPIFRASDWSCYQQVNRKFADAVLNEMEGSDNPIVLIQDYHFALAPRMIKQARPDARVAIFWHIPWPNPEAFSICPWQTELLDGMLGADLIGFHIQSHCNNFLESVDRTLESRIEWDHFTVKRENHITAVHPYPISVVFPEVPPSSLVEKNVTMAKAALRKQLGIDPLFLGVGVDRVDYTKGILERFLAVEKLLESQPAYIGQFTFVQIGSPSRTQIKRYHDLLEETSLEAERINK